eukprot:1437771-Prymnesium_polylepis.1
MSEPGRFRDGVSVSRLASKAHGLEPSPSHAEVRACPRTASPTSAASCACSALGPSTFEPSGWPS